MWLEFTQGLNIYPVDKESCAADAALLAQSWENLGKSAEEIIEEITQMCEVDCADTYCGVWQKLDELGISR